MYSLEETTFVKIIPVLTYNSLFGPNFDHVRQHYWLVSLNDDCNIREISPVYMSIEERCPINSILNQKF